jgi:hypothetical protein
MSAQNFVCGLSEKQEHDAPAAFAKLMPLFLTPRCFNCHGGVSPFIRMRTGNQVITLTPRGNHPDLDQSEGTVVRDRDGNEDFGATFAACDTCHDVGFGKGQWRLAPFQPDMQFGPRGVPKTALQLCMQMKTKGRKPGAAGFIGHMKDDNGDTNAPFLATAFQGTMALDDEQVDAAKDDLKDKGGYPAPIAIMTRAQALQLAEDWVAEMGGKFRLPDDCGCKEHHYALRVLAHGMAQLRGMTWNLRFDGQGTAFPEIPLEFKDDGTLSGEVMAVPVTDNQGAFPFVSCSGERTDLIKVVVQGSWQDITPASYEPTSDPPSPPKNPIRIRLTFSQVQTNARETCSTPFGAVSGGSNQTGPQQYPFDLVFPDPQVNQAVAVDWPAPFPGWTGAVRGQIIEVGGSGGP